MRTLFLTPYYKPYLGGIERVIDRLAQEYLVSGAMRRVGVLTTHYAFPRQYVPGLLDRQSLDGQEIFRLHSFPHTAPPAFSVPLVWFSPLEMRRAIRDFQPDVLHFVGDGWFWAHLWCAEWARERGAAVVFTPSFHVLPAHRQWLRPLNAALGRASQVTTVLTALERERVRAAYRIPAERLRVLPWGVDLPSDASRAAGARAPDDPVTVLCVGRLGRHKGQAWLIDTFARTRERVQRPARLVLVGRDEGDAQGEAALRRQIAELGLTGTVEIIGEVDDMALAAWYGRADLFALFSQYEAFGLAALEALGRGVPVITHRVGANAEVLRAGAVLVEPYDREAAVSALASLVTDDAARARLGAAGQAYVRATFSWQRAAAGYVAAYEVALARRRMAQSMPGRVPGL
jgi:glycosyltransferase involved in cell wall biosynthesis